MRHSNFNLTFYFYQDQSTLHDCASKIRRRGEACIIQKFHPPTRRVSWKERKGSSTSTYNLQPTIRWLGTSLHPFARSAQPLVARPTSTECQVWRELCNYCIAPDNCRGKRRLPEWPECLGERGARSRDFLVDLLPCSSYVSFPV